MSECKHNVNPATDRCVLCGKNAFNRGLEIITGRRDDLEKCGSYVIPTKDGNYHTPPAMTVETFWMFKYAPDGSVICNDHDMRLMYKQVDPGTFACIGEAQEVTDALWQTLVSTRDHPQFIGGHQGDR